MSKLIVATKTFANPRTAPKRYYLNLVPSHSSFH